MLLCYWCGREIEDESTVRFQGMVQWMDFCSWSCADAYREMSMRRQGYDAKSGKDDM